MKFHENDNNAILLFSFNVILLWYVWTQHCPTFHKASQQKNIYVYFSWMVPPLPLFLRLNEISNYYYDDHDYHYLFPAEWAGHLPPIFRNRGNFLPLCASLLLQLFNSKTPSSENLFFFGVDLPLYFKNGLCIVLLTEWENFQREKL